MTFALIVDRTALLAAFALVHGSVAKRSGIPVLSHALIDATGPSLAVCGTNLDVYATAEIDPINVDAPWSATYPWEPLNTLVTNLPEGSQIELYQDGTRVGIKCGRTKAKWATLPVTEFPGAPVMPADAVSFEIEATEFARILGTVAPFVDPQFRVPAWSGVHLHADTAANALVAVGTTGKAIVAVSTVLPEGAQTMPAVTLPMDAVSVLLSAIKSAAGAVTLEVSDAMVRLVTGVGSITCKLIADKYVDYRRVVPIDLSRHATVDRRALIGALSRVLPLSDQETKSLLRNLTVEIADGVATLSTSDRAASGDAEESIDCESEPAAMRFGMNGENLRKILGTIDAEMVQIRMGAKMESYVIEPVGAADGGLRLTAATRV